MKLVTIIFTVILLAILIATILVIRSNYRLRKVVPPEKKIDLRVGRNAVVQISENREGNIRIDIGQFGDSGLPGSVLEMSDDRKRRLADDEQDMDVGVKPSVSRETVMDIVNLPMLPVGQRRQVLDKLRESGRIDDEKYAQLEAQYITCYESTGSDSDSPQDGGDDGQAQVSGGSDGQGGADIESGLDIVSSEWDRAFQQEKQVT